MDRGTGQDNWGSVDACMLDASDMVVDMLLCQREPFEVEEDCRGMQPDKVCAASSSVAVHANTAGADSWMDRDMAQHFEESVVVSDPEDFVVVSSCYCTVLFADLNWIEDEFDQTSPLP